MSVLNNRKGYKNETSVAELPANTKDKLRRITDVPPAYGFKYSTKYCFDKWRQETIQYYIEKYGENKFNKAWLSRPMNPCKESVAKPEEVEEIIVLFSDNILKRMKVEEFRDYVMETSSKPVKVLILGESRYKGLQQITYNLQASKCELIEHIILYNGITEMGEGCLSDLPKLKNLVLPPSVDKIGQFAFAYDIGLERIVFPKGLEQNIYDNAFYGTIFNGQGIDSNVEWRDKNY